MILAAGLGTRLRPWTYHHPKALALVHGKPLLQWNVEYLQKFGIMDVIVNVHHFADQVIEAVEANDGWGSRITISDETDIVLETGGGLKKAAWYFGGESFIMMNVDVLTDMDLTRMISFHLQHEPLATLAVTSRSTSRYFLFGEDGNLCGWENVQTGERKMSKPCEITTRKAFSGIHVISPTIFALIKHKGKFSMVDVYLELAGDARIRGFDHSDSKFIDVGKPESITRAQELFPGAL
jgi:NDP-sugar pyrophosphorylase family protein